MNYMVLLALYAKKIQDRVEDKKYLGLKTSSCPIKIKRSLLFVLILGKNMKKQQNLRFATSMDLDKPANDTYLHNGIEPEILHCDTTQVEAYYFSRGILNL